MNEEILNVYKDLEEDIMFYMACTNLNIQMLPFTPIHGFRKNFVYPFICKSLEEFKEKYRDFIKQIEIHITKRCQTSDVIIVVCEPVIKFDNKLICGFFEIYWIEKELYVNKIVT